MTVTFVMMGLAAAIFSGLIGTRSRESRKTDALSSARAALNTISREIANSGYGLKSNGIVTTDSNGERLHIRANLNNSDLATNGVGEDVTYFYDAANQSIVRYDPNDSPQTSVIVNRVSSVEFRYYDYTDVNSNPSESGNQTPTADTGRVRVTVTVELEDVPGQPANQKVVFRSDVTLRNSKYMLNQY
jgi:poly-gamma-glutamate capsule biosynthesis protein CapA/YwtB (metallophosphatase superfamily)